MRDLSLGLKIIRQFEGFRTHSYQDSVGVWTIGYGTIVGVHPGMVITPQQAEHLLEIDAQHRASQLENYIHVPVNDNQFAALLSLVYNIGLGAFYHSHLLTELNQGSPKEVVAERFMDWIHAGGRVLGGLVTRRKEEKSLFLA